MNQQEILKKIGGIIAELKEQYTYIQESDSAFNELELELFMANANFLTDHIDILKKISGLPKQIAPPAPMPVITFEEIPPSRPQIPDYFNEEEHSLYAENTEIKPENVFSHEIAEVDSIEIPSEEITAQEVIILPETMPETIAEELPAIKDASFTAQKPTEPEAILVEEKVTAAPIEINIQTTAPPQRVFEVELKNPIIQEQIQVEEKKNPVTEEAKPLTLNERIAAQRGLETAVVKPESAKNNVQDLQSLINLNDKLLFIKELFSGYNLAYSEAINILNRYTTFEQAENFLKVNYVIKNNWKEKPATADRFYEILKKKYN